ncbi:uncharacterized protein LOC143038014 [Oratosquilla oratoria]|uniref:uncharacterized protein LOC143038014 n=1 Tax=Oratosquilla oratoria TaxID=337810 RepID=UPI003F76B27B
MSSKLRVEDVLEYVDTVATKQIHHCFDFMYKVAELFQATLKVLDKYPDRQITQGSYPKGASASHRRRRERRKNDFVSYMKTLPTSICLNSKLFPTDSIPIITVHRLFQMNLYLDIKEAFMADIFKIEEKENNNFYIVRTETSKPSTAVLKKYIGKNQMLQLNKLNEAIIKEFQGMLGIIDLPLLVTRSDKAIYVLVDDDFEETRFTIQPRIPVSSMVWKNCPSLVAIGELPKLVQKLIRMRRELHDFILFVTLVPEVDPSRYEEELRNMFYTRLEMLFFVENGEIGKMVKLVKLAAIAQGWCTLGLTEYHIHQIALREADNLCFKTRREGFIYILKSVKEELVSTSSKADFFVKQVHFGIKEENINLLLESIDEVLKFLPEDLMAIAEGIEEYMDDSDDYNDDDEDDDDFY